MGDIQLANVMGYRQGVTVEEDAFGRGRVSQPVTLFDSQLQYNLAPLSWEQILVGGASITHLPAQSSALLTCGTANGDRAVRQSKGYFRYQPGKSQLIVCTGILGAPKTNVVRRVGYFDDGNGVFFQQDNTDIAVCTRSSTSGSVVNDLTSQAQWNLDRLDGSGSNQNPSGILLDPTKNQIFVMDLQWLGAGRVRFGIEVAGRLIYVHQDTHSNEVAGVYMTTANLPVRYEIVNTGVTGSSTSLTQICAAVISEGGFEEERGYPFTASNGVTSIAVNARRPIFSVRPRLLFNAIPNRAQFKFEDLELLVGSMNLFWEIVLNPALTGASFADVNTASSAMQADVSATALTGGTTILSGYSAAGGTRIGTTSLLNFRIPFGLDAAGAVQDILTVAGAGIGGAGTANAGFNWREFY